MTISRREFSRSVLAGIAATSVVGAGGCGSDGAGGSGGGGSGGSGGGGMNGCTLYPEQTPGPFYLDLDLLRRDITEEKTGAALRVEMVVQSVACVSLKDIAVDLWHCDAAGVYSGFSGQLGGLDTTGETFLRGTQITDTNGLAAFDTIYPGWYPGRTTHIHFTVRTSSTTAATSQIYFPESVTSEVYAIPPYDARGPKDTPNGADGIAVTAPAPLAEVVGNDVSGYTATILVTVA